MLRLLGALWGTATSVRASLYQRGWLPVHRLGRPVISIGALAVGGVGKTPAVAAIAELLLQAGQRPAILSRGYRRRGRAPLLVAAGDGHGPRAPARRAGDEPTWLAQVLPSAVVAVAPRREDAAALALSAAAVDLFILDDGFQHLRVGRDANCLVVDSGSPFWFDAPLPAGRLREPVAAAARADAFLLVGKGGEQARAVLAQRHPRTPVFDLVPASPAAWELNQNRAADERLAAPDGARQPRPADPIPPAELPSPLFAFAGIARPERFFGGLRAAGVKLVGERCFPDHHPFSRSAVSSLEEAARSSGAAALVTTEKDAVRLPPQLPDLPLYVWRYRLRPEEPEALRNWLGQRIGAQVSGQTLGAAAAEGH